MFHDSSASDNASEDTILPLRSNEFLPGENIGTEETSSTETIINHNNNNNNNNNDNNKKDIFPQQSITLRKEKEKEMPPSELRQNLFMVFITLTQLVQMIPLGAGINSGLAIGKALGATNLESVWIVASYPLTQGSFVLIGKFCVSVLSNPPFPLFAFLSPSPFFNI